MAKVILDAAHGGNDLGAVYNNRFEKNDTLRLANEIGKLLVDNGLEVSYTRTDDQYRTILDRIEIANEQNGDIFLSLHRGYGPEDNRYSYAVAYGNEVGGPEQEVAENILDNLEDIGFRNQGFITRKDRLELRMIEYPSLFLEVGVINTDADNELLDNRLQDIATAVTDGILETFSEVGIMSNKELRPVRGCNCTEINQRREEDRVYRYRVQVGLFRLYNNAFGLQQQLLFQGLPAVIDKQGELYAVHVGDFSNMDDAVRLEWILRFRGRYDTLLIAV
ncbi:MAG: N-acetylmuramoyl-L-alanine amidase [Herbinix sp.]|jgi:N-acetylmuramoyl-L-alanine amidase|nr:N-acetylmuramoyl-L-alanine amidase [Herbinix sp.]